MRTVGELAKALQAIADAEGGERFLGDVARWYDDGPRWRCVNDHVSRRYLKSEQRGCVCLACGEPLCLTFPEDVDGPLVPPPAARAT